MMIRQPVAERVAVPARDICEQKEMLLGDIEESHSGRAYNAIEGNKLYLSLTLKLSSKKQ